MVMRNKRISKNLQLKTQQNYIINLFKMNTNKNFFFSIITITKK